MSRRQLTAAYPAANRVLCKASKPLGICGPQYLATVEKLRQKEKAAAAAAAAVAAAAASRTPRPQKTGPRRKAKV
jgi:hypothetical protein